MVHPRRQSIPDHNKKKTDTPRTTPVQLLAKPQDRFLSWYTKHERFITGLLYGSFMILTLIVVGYLCVLVINQYNSPRQKYYRWLGIAYNSSRSDCETSILSPLYLVSDPASHPNCKNCNEKTSQLKEAYDFLIKQKNAPNF